MEGGFAVAWALIVIVILMILLFVGVQSSGNRRRNWGYRNRGHDNRGYDNRGYDNRRYDNRRYDNRNAAYAWQQEPAQGYAPQHYSQPRGAGCRRVLVLVVLASLIFVGAVIYWSVTVQAGGGFF
jgi:hypothetical protein